MIQKHIWNELSTGFNFTPNCLWLYHAGQPPSKPCPGQGAGFNSQFAEIEEIKSNKTVPLVKPLRDGSYLVIACNLDSHLSFLVCITFSSLPQ